MDQGLKRITYVDDEADIRAVTALLLEKLGGFTVDPCAGGREALERMTGFAPDLVLLDVMMPDMDGPQTLQKMRTTPGLAHLPVLFVTARSQAHEMAGYRALGVDGVIAKPFEPMGLPEELREIWKGLEARAEAV